MEHVSLDLWAVNLEPPLPNLDAWLARLEGRMAHAAQRGSQILVLPEFACAQWLSFAPLDLPPQHVLGWLAEVGGTALASMSALSARYGVSLLAGTLPFQTTSREGGPAYLNRAWLLKPDGTSEHQDKLSLTPYEQSGAGGPAIAGNTINVIAWNGLRLAIVICLDVEYTALWSRLGSLDLDLILVPAKTDMITGYNRVFGCARTRAIELQTAVCAIGAVGVPLGVPAVDTGVGGASAFVPCDVSISLDGVFATHPPQTAAMFSDPVLHVPHLPVGLCRRLRNGHAEAEVFPAAWDAAHVIINDPAPLGSAA